jgi:uncharacterized protein YjgD (DUF1641 family)
MTMTDEDALTTAIEENPEEVVRLLRRLGQVNDLLDTLDLATAALDDEMVRTLARTSASLGEVADAAADPDTVQGIETTLEAIGEASAAEPGRVGTIGLLRALRDPDVQRGMGFLLAIARATGEGLDADTA